MTVVDVDTTEDGTRNKGGNSSTEIIISKGNSGHFFFLIGFFHSIFGFFTTFRTHTTKKELTNTLLLKEE